MDLFRILPSSSPLDQHLRLHPSLVLDVDLTPHTTSPSSQDSTRTFNLVQADLHLRLSQASRSTQPLVQRWTRESTAPRCHQCQLRVADQYLQGPLGTEEEAASSSGETARQERAVFLAPAQQKQKDTFPHLTQAHLLAPPVADEAMLTDDLQPFHATISPQS